MTQAPLISLVEINPESLGPGTSLSLLFDYIDISAVSVGVINWSDVRRVRYADAPSRAQRRVIAGDVLLCTVRPGLKAHAQISSNNGVPQVASTGFAVLRPHRRIDSSYVLHQLFSGEVSAQLRAMETGSNYPAVNEGDVARIVFYTPPPEERAQIGAVLDLVDGAIVKTAAVIGKLKQIRAGLLHDLLTCGLDANGQLRDPNRPDKFKPSPLGRIPNEWMVAKVEDAGDVRLGRQRSPSHESGSHMRPYLRVANVFDGYIDYSDVFTMNFSPVEQNAYGLAPGDILLNEGQSLELVGRSAIYDGPAGVYCFQNTLVRFRCTEAVIPEFALAVFKYWLDTRRFTLIAKQTTSVAHLGADRFAKMPFAIPPIDEQRRIVDALQLNRSDTELTRRSLVKLQRLKAGLMSDLLTGRIRVPEEALT